MMLAFRVGISFCDNNINRAFKIMAIIFALAFSVCMSVLQPYVPSS